jgi:hypothetical protein
MLGAVERTNRDVLSPRLGPPVIAGACSSSSASKPADMAAIGIRRLDMLGRVHGLLLAARWRGARCFG